MDFNNIMEFVKKDVLFIVPALWIIGYFLKSTPTIKDWIIPYILLVVGVVFSCLTLGFNANGIVQGILVTGAAVLGNQLVKQAQKK